MSRLDIAGVFACISMANLAFDAWRLFELRDEILEHIYTHHRDVWTRIGKPTGWQWKPRGESMNFTNPVPNWLNGDTDAEWLPAVPEVGERYLQQMKIKRRLYRFDFPLMVICMIVASVIGTIMDQQSVKPQKNNVTHGYYDSGHKE